MRALDTNVLARFFVDDADDEQAVLQRPAAMAALAERSFVSMTVLLELEWVLRGFYELPARAATSADSTDRTTRSFRPSDSSCTSITAPGPIPRRRLIAAGSTI